MENSSATAIGKLYIVATPIGNLADISARAISVLKSVDAILAEDTRHSRPLLNSLHIQNTLISLHDHNENEKSNFIIEQLKTGKNFALISDAGTPLISDPGFILVRKARQENIMVVPIPGACAVITALCAAGIPCDSFAFAGFLPAKTQARQEKLQSFHAFEQTVVVYESTHRIIDCLEDIAAVNGLDYQLILAKELTKSYEHFIHDSVLKIKHWLLAESGRCKGEFVLILPVLAKKESTDNDTKLLKLLLAELPLKKAVEIADSISSATKNMLYKKALLIKKDMQNE